VQAAIETEKEGPSMTALGPLALLAALCAGVYGAGASVYGRRTNRLEWIESGWRAGIAVTGLILLAVAALLAALLSHDFSYAYVVEHTSLATPWYFRISSFYSGQQGSLLYWVLVVAIFGTVVMLQHRRRYPELMPYVVATLLSIEVFFLFVLVFVSGPFDRLAQPPADGAGLNPILQDPGMLIHPPMLLAGLATWSVPFAFVVAALASGRLGNEWIRATRRYALIAWCILGIGNLLGAWWSYHVLGWGGYWGWDAVENGAIMPWLVGTAYLHSVMVQERRGMLKVWNVGLLMLAFCLSIFGTFVVRSGILTSVHSFAQSSIGPFFFGFFVVVLIACVGLVYWRMPLLQSENTIDSPLSREGAFLLNNVLFLGLVFATFWGTILPLLSDALRGQTMTVGPPFFNQVDGPIALALLLLMGVGPLLPWRRADRARLWQTLVGPLAVALAASVVLAIIGVRDPLALIGLGACAFVVATTAAEFWGGLQARRRHSGEGLLLAARRLVRRNNRRYGGYIVHLAIVLIGLGLIGSSFYKVEEKDVLAPGQSAQMQGFTLTFQGLKQSSGPDTTTLAAPLVVSQGGHALGTLTPTRVTHLNIAEGDFGQTSSGVAINTIHLKDLYVVLSDTTPGGNASLLIFINPLVSLIWAGGPLLLLGFLICFWPEARPRRRVLPAPPAEVVLETA
jgi:cytochrome c-type biogenesis protein CcmF